LADDFRRRRFSPRHFASADIGFRMSADTPPLAILPLIRQTLLRFSERRCRHFAALRWLPPMAADAVADAAYADDFRIRQRGLRWFFSPRRRRCSLQPYYSPGWLCFFDTLPLAPAHCAIAPLRYFRRLSAMPRLSAAFAPAEAAEYALPRAAPVLSRFRAMPRLRRRCQPPPLMPLTPFSMLPRCFSPADAPRPSAPISLPLPLLMPLRCRRFS
jgi:hypothetical protein